MVVAYVFVAWLSGVCGGFVAYFQWDASLFEALGVWVLVGNLTLIPVACVHLGVLSLGARPEVRRFANLAQKQIAAARGERGFGMRAPL